MYFQSLDPGLSQYAFATGRSPVSRILVAEHGACSKRYRHDGSRCVLGRIQEFVRGRHVAFRSAHCKEVENRFSVSRLYPASTSILRSFFFTATAGHVVLQPGDAFLDSEAAYYLVWKDKASDTCRAPPSWSVNGLRYRTFAATYLRPSEWPRFWMPAFHSLACCS